MNAPRHAPDTKSARKPSLSMDSGRAERRGSRHPKKMILLGPLRSNMAEILRVEKISHYFLVSFGSRYLPSIIFSDSILV